MLREFAADALRSNWHGVAGQDLEILRRPIRLELLDLPNPARATHRGAVLRQLAEPTKRLARIAEHPRLERVVPSEDFRIDVDLDGGRADGGHGPEVSGHPSGLRSDEHDEIRLADDEVCRLAGVGSDHAHRQGVCSGDGVLAVRRRGNRDQRSLGERDEFVTRERGPDSASGDDDGALGTLEKFEYRDQAGIVRQRPKRGNLCEFALDDRLIRGLTDVDLSLVPLHLEVHRAGSSRSWRRETRA